MTRSRARQLTRGLAVARCAIGALGMVAPALACRVWTGQSSDVRALRMVGRAMAGRDLALGTGTVVGLRHDAPVRGWLEAAALADAADFAVTLAHFRSIPRASRLLVLVGAGAGAAGSALLARQADEAGTGS